MNGQEYLNEISAQAQRPVKKSSGGILHSKFFIVGAVGIILLILIMILGAILGSGKDDEGKTTALKLHLDATMEEIEIYQTDVKSSSLRSHSASLNSVLSSTSSQLATFLETKYGLKEGHEDKGLVAEAEAAQATLETSLFEAKINGNLDQVYAHKMAYEIAMFMNEEMAILKSTNNEELTGILTTSYESLDQLYDSFNDFSSGS